MLQKYSRCLGSTSRGVDWNGEESQTLRFDVLTRITNLQKSKFSANELGCGCGSLLHYFHHHGYSYDYLGLDISPSMFSLTEPRHKKSECCSFLLDSRHNRVAAYTFASRLLKCHAIHTGKRLAGLHFRKRFGYER
jgi:hypothetical protein